jgi:hypothetical protein
MPFETTAPFSSTAGALECHRSDRGNGRISAELPEFAASLREFGQSAAMADIGDISIAAMTTAKMTRNFGSIRSFDFVARWQEPSEAI